MGVRGSGCNRISPKEDKKFSAHDHHSQRIRTVLKQINSNTVTEIKELLVSNFMKNVTIISKAETEPYAFYRKSKARALTQQEKDIDRMPQPVTISSPQPNLCNQGGCSSQQVLPNAE